MSQLKHVKDFSLRQSIIFLAFLEGFYVNFLFIGVRIYI